MKMRIPDREMILSLMGSSAHQRHAISWWLFENFKKVEITPGFDHAYPDKNALSIEILAQYMGQLETLEMVYFALREKVLAPARSFTECYLGIYIKEYDPSGSRPPSRWCAHTMLEQIKGMTVERFVAELGMPSLEAVAAARCGDAIERALGGKEEFDEEVLRLIDWMYRAIENKANRSLHQAFVKSKHGFGVLTSPHYPEIHFIEGTQPKHSSECVADVFQFDNSEESLQILVKDTGLIRQVIRDLLGLYVGRSPVHCCAKCDAGEMTCKEEEDPVSR